MGTTILASFTLFKFSVEYKMFRNSQYTKLSCVYQALSLVSIGYEKIQRFKARDYSECVIRKLLCVLERHPCARPIIARYFPVSLPYRTLEKFNGTSKFLLIFQFACVPINHYCSIDVQQNIGNSLLYHSVTKGKNCCSQLLCIEVNVPGLEIGTK